MLYFSNSGEIPMKLFVVALTITLLATPTLAQTACNSSGVLTLEETLVENCPAASAPFPTVPAVAKATSVAPLPAVRAEPPKAHPGGTVTFNGMTYDLQPPAEPKQKSAPVQTARV